MRIIFHILGILLTTLGGFMVLPAIADLATGSPNWKVFLASACSATFVGLGLMVTSRGGPREMHLRQAFLLTTASWLVIVGFGALPFVYSDLQLSYTDAFFEAMSGITTTGSTILTGLDTAPRGILLWRAILQWLGGLGIIVMAIAILPALQIGGMQIFRIEGFETTEQVFARGARYSLALSLVYLAITILCAVLLWIAGMTSFEATAHAMTTVSTGGFSTSDGSIGHFNSVAIDFIIVAFMLLGGMPFILFIEAIRGKGHKLWRDSQVRWFIATVGAAVLIITIYQLVIDQAGLFESFRRAVFNCVSTITGTGFSSTAYDLWGPFAMAVFFLLMFIGGCAGSTSCSIKIFRYQILFQFIKSQYYRLIYPNRVFRPTYNKRAVPLSAVASVMSFFFIYFLSIAVLALALTAVGLDLTTALSGAATSVSNVGPGLGEMIGPAGTFAALPDIAKWLLSIGMLLGRLEFFTVLILFMPTFWRG